MMRQFIKKLKLALLLGLVFTTLSSNAQDFDQLVRTPDGKYGLIKIEDTPIHENIFHVIIKVRWVDQNLQDIDEREALLAINNAKISNSQSSKVFCTSFEGNDFKSFNEKLDLAFAIEEHFGVGTINLAFNFVYINKKTKQTIGLQKLQFKQPSDLIYTREIKAGEVVVLDKTPPKIVITSEPDLSRGFKPVYDEQTVILTGNVSDASPLKNFTVNGRAYSLMTNGDFSVSLELIKGENKIIVEATDDKNNKAHEVYYMTYMPPLPPENIVSANNSTGVNDTTSGLSGNFYALIIGVNEYADPDINPLDKPVQDAQSLYDILTTQYTFEAQNVKFLKNPTRAEMIDALDNYASILKEKDNLLIFYAGHGYWDETKKIGYWMPSDARRKSTANWLRNTTLQSYIAAIPTHHTLLIADACFSGGIFKTRKAFADASKGINKLYELPSRKAMTSGTLKEVPDESVFLHLLVKRLKQNKMKYISSESLFSSFRDGVLNNSPNIPQFGTIRNSGDEGGDFIFIKR